MLNYFKTIAFAVTILSFYSASISTLSKPAFAGEPIIDKNCQFHERTAEVFQKIPIYNQGKILQTSSFQINNQKYALQLLKFPNYTGVLCLWKPNARRLERLTNLSLIQEQVIEKFENDAYKSANYIVTVRGDKTENILKTIYRLNLTNPNQPKLTPLIRVYKK